MSPVLYSVNQHLSTVHENQRHGIYNLVKEKVKELFSEKTFLSA